MPVGVFSARRRTPVLHPAAQRKSAPNCKSWNDLSSTSQPPVGDFAVPTSTPLAACQLASPRTCHPVNVEPLKVQSGTNVLLVPCTGAVNTSAIAATAPTPVSIRFLMILLQPETKPGS